MVVVVMVMIMVIIHFNNNDNMPLSYYTVKYLLYIRLILVVWRRITGQTGAFATGQREVLSGVL
jgi:hypothetical protein